MSAQTIHAAGRGVAAAPVLILGQVLSLQAGAAVAKNAYGTVGPTAMAGMRLAFAAVILWVLVRPRPRALTRRQWRAAGLLGVVFAAMNLTYFQAIEHLPIGVAATLELLGPLALSILLARRAAHVLAAVLALTGVLLLATPGASLPAVGLVLGGTAALCRAGYVLLNRRVGRLFPDWTGLAVALACGACLLTPVAALTGGREVAAHPSALGTGLAVAVLSSLVPYALDMTVLRRIDTRAFGVLLALGPAMGAGIGYLVLHEELTGRQMAAMALIVLVGAWSTRHTAGPVDGPAARPVARPVAVSGGVSPADDDRCLVCGGLTEGESWRWTLLSRHRTSAGEVEYCVAGCGCQVVLLDGELIKTVRRRPAGASRRGPDAPGALPD